MTDASRIAEVVHNVIYRPLPEYGPRTGCLRRQGEVSAEALQQQFALAFQSQASTFYLELAELLPSPGQRAQLLSAASRAGWIAPDRALDDGEFRVDLGGGAPDQAVSDGWRPLDLSRLQAAASAMAVEPVRVYFLKECFGVNIPPNHPDDEALLRVPTIALCYPWCGSAGR